jgi:glycosyltransferase involved in cell wall biosynthesis
MKKLKVFNVAHHLAHQHSLFKIPFFDFTWVRQYRRPYSLAPRGDFVKNWVMDYEPGMYDLALLHIDQQIADEDIATRGKGKIYLELNEVIKDIPKIVINHGTPYWPERFYTNENKNDQQKIIDIVKGLVGDNYMVVNSHKAAEQWGWGKPIWHAMDPAEWWDVKPKEARVVTMISPGGLDDYYDREFLEAIKNELAERDIRMCQITVDKITENWDEYRKFLGSSLIYINPTKESPMPRARTEAMLSGCCVLTTPHQDADMFIKHGENGFIIPRNPQDVADLVEKLINNYSQAIAIGQRGKQTATELFNIDRYSRDWAEVVKDVLGFNPLEQ